MIRTRYDSDPTGTVPYAAIKVGDDVLLYINTALFLDMDAEFRQFLTNQVLAEIDHPQADDGARIIDLAVARASRAGRTKVSALAGVNTMSAVDLADIGPLLT